jgi:predicted transcriptional regulator
MSNKTHDSRLADKFVVRLPDGLREQVDQHAAEVHTSMNSVFVLAVKQYLDGQQRQQLLLDALAQAAEKVEVADASA